MEAKYAVGAKVLAWMVACVVLSGSLVWWMVSTVPADVDAVDLDLEPCAPCAATVPGAGWGFAVCRPDQVGEVVFSPSGQAVLNCVCGD